MVSPSKVQHQKQKHPSRKNISNKSSHVRIQKGQKPLEKKFFYLDIKNHAVSTKLEVKIKDLGGAIELFLVRNVTLVITDRVNKTSRIDSEKRKWGCTSGGSGGPPSLKSIEGPTFIPTPTTPLLSSEFLLSNSSNLRVQTTQRSKSRVDAMLERALTQPQQCSVDPLDNAQNWGIPIWATDKFQAWLDKIYASFKDTDNLDDLKHKDQQKSARILKVKHLRKPYIKFESFGRDTRPVFLELSSWPTLNFNSNPRSCPFDTKRQEKVGNNPIDKEIKENGGEIVSINRKESKEMTRRPRATAGRARRTEQLGYCEICHVDYQDLAKHVQSDQHLNFVRNNDNFLSLDTLIDAGASVEAFLKLNRTKDIGKDCNLFSNEERDLRDVLPEEKNDKTTETLDSFNVEEIKMVQCNGTRRNLNLKLNSSHNLRTRTKHESGHLLRSKGSPWHELDKNEKFYEKFEGFTIKKRAKGTIWIEEEDPEDKYAQEELQNSKDEDCKVDDLLKENEIRQSDYKGVNSVNTRQNDQNSKQPCYGSDNVYRTEHTTKNTSDSNNKIYNEFDGNIRTDLSKSNKINVNGLTNNSFLTARSFRSDNEKVFDTISDRSPEQKALIDRKLVDGCGINASEIILNGHNDKSHKGFKTVQYVEKEARYGEPKSPRIGSRRGGRNFRGRHRLSVEERLIEDNRAYYKVEVLGSKLRSSTIPGNNPLNCGIKESDGEKKEEIPSNEKPVVVRFKRVRKSELSLLSDEAESFMFGEPKRDDTSEVSDEGNNSSILPRDTESECNDAIASNLYSSSLVSSTSIKEEAIEDDSQDSVNLDRPRKRRRTQTEALIKDNADYYKFETPGSRLRYQAPLIGIKESVVAIENSDNKSVGTEKRLQTDVIETIYPSKPSAEIEKMQFSFEAVPKSEPWYQTYQRQDEGAEFWHYFSERDTRRPFLLPYEIENFHETLFRSQAKSEGRRKGRGRGVGCMGRSPRKSPRCHASTLAIMSTIIRKREQQQISSSFFPTEECQPSKSHVNISKSYQKQDSRFDIDENNLKEIAKSIDEMLSTKDATEETDGHFGLENFEIEDAANIVESSGIPKGPPLNLLELLDNCHEMVTCLENSSCASSECGEGSTELPLKRRKKRKNRTGWPGIKLRKKLPSKPLLDLDGENELEKRIGQQQQQQQQQQQRCDVAFEERVDAAKVSDRLTEQARGNIITTHVTALLNTEEKADLDKEGKNLNGMSQKGYNKNAVVARDNSGVDIGGGNETLLHVEDCVPSNISKICNESQRIVLDKNLSEVDEEVSENDPGNDENHVNVIRKDVNSLTILDRQFMTKSVMKKRPHINASSDSCESKSEMKNQDILCKKDSRTAIVPRKHHDSNMCRRRQQQNNPINQSLRSHNVHQRGRVTSSQRINSRKRQRRNNGSSDSVFDDGNCKKQSYLSITCRKQQTLRSVKRRRETISSEDQVPELECALSERVSPTMVTSSELEQRRSSIEFQPVVRMMKIDDQVDIDHSILSVTVASNRRLRSSSLQRSNTKPPKKRLKTTGRGQFGRWLKSS